MRCLVPQKPIGDENDLVPCERLDPGMADNLFSHHDGDQRTDLECAEQSHLLKEGIPTIFAQPEQNIHDGQETTSNETSSQPNDCANILTTECFEMGPRALWTNVTNGSRTPRELINFGLETDLDFSSMDLDFLDMYNARAPFEFGLAATSTTLLDQCTIDQNEGREKDDRNMDPMLRWTGHFIPAPQDHAYAEHAHLSLPAEVASHESPQSLLNFEKRMTAERLEFTSRDKILGIILSQVKPPVARAVSSFPSGELLDCLIQYFLSVPFSGASTWVHGAGFQPKKTRPELLLAMAAAGAVLTPDNSLRKLGFAMHEVVRNYLPTVFEGDNTTIRDLELHQAFMLCLEIGLWSGNSRKIEISESFQQPLLTMLRRGGMLFRSGYPPITLRPEDEGQILEDRWRSWIRNESHKRLVYHLLQHDAQSSMVLQINPAMSYAELSLPLPASEDLWTASCAQDWKDIYILRANSGSICIPSLIECIANFDVLDPSHKQYDLSASCLAVLHGIWGLVREYRQVDLLLCNQPRYWDSGLMMTSRYQELIKMLDYFRIGHEDESPLFLNLILMHMHMSLNDIQEFASLENFEDSGRDRRSMGEWATSKAARQAVWYAAQVVREVKSLPRLNIRDFKAVALYHASLALWAYGMGSHMVAQDPTDNQSVSSSQKQKIITLDGEYTDDVQRYIALGKGSPVLHEVQHRTRYTLLSDPRSILELVITIMEKNHDGSCTAQPPLVANLIHLLEGLRGATK